MDGAEHLFFIADALSEPPQVAFDVDCAVAAISPVVFPVIVDGGFADDDGAVSAGTGTVLVDVVDEEQNALGVATANGSRTDTWRHVFPPGLMATLGDHDEGVAIGEFAVFDAARFAFDFQANDEAEGLAKPVDCLAGVVVEEGR